LQPVFVTRNKENDTTIDFTCKNLNGIQLGPYIKLYSTALDNELCFFSALSLLTRKAEIVGDLPSADEVLSIAAS